MSGASILILLLVAFIAFKLVKGVIGFIFKLAVIAALVMAFLYYQKGGF